MVFFLSEGSRVNSLIVFEISTTMIELIDIAADDIMGDMVNPTE
jgi:hypothetical protein